MCICATGLIILHIIDLFQSSVNQYVITSLARVHKHKYIFQSREVLAVSTVSWVPLTHALSVSSHFHNMLWMILCLSRCLWVKKIFNNLHGHTDFSSREVHSRSTLDQIIQPRQAVCPNVSGKTPEAMDKCEHAFFQSSPTIIHSPAVNFPLYVSLSIKFLLGVQLRDIEFAKVWSHSVG